MATISHFGQENAPCGRTAGSEHVRDDDEDGFVIDHVYFACGCRTTRHQFHDGSVQLTVRNHRGRIVSYEHSSMHEA